MIFCHTGSDLTKGYEFDFMKLKYQSCELLKSLVVIPFLTSIMINLKYYTSFFSTNYSF
jgi:hypothetical protein